MMIKSRCALVLLSVTLLLAASTRAMGDEGTVLRVVVVETENVGAYVKELARGEAMRKALGSPAQVRIWQARFAGPQAGAVVVSIEYASLEALAEDDAKLKANPEYMAWLKGLDKIRKIISDSLYDELGS